MNAVFLIPQLPSVQTTNSSHLQVRKLSQRRYMPFMGFNTCKGRAEGRFSANPTPESKLWTVLPSFLGIRRRDRPPRLQRSLPYIPSYQLFIHAFFLPLGGLKHCTSGWSGIHYIDKSGLEFLASLLHQPSQCWDCRQEPCRHNMPVSSVLLIPRYLTQATCEEKEVGDWKSKGKATGLERPPLSCIPSQKIEQWVHAEMQLMVLPKGRSMGGAQLAPLTITVSHRNSRSLPKTASLSNSLTSAHWGPISLRLHHFPMAPSPWDLGLQHKQLAHSQNINIAKI